eukprot:CAMPEP_0174893780 /NCGR_PEP_ID=MMETSP0167-20121228/8546_1 /TAXON_ID=38298 /ORGANISM="Rhodella maculata, Strain CCMP736" /LENGTH=342 /DNA_ID=CAMNT_0016132681 /DNA_START=22 /DNA_END=1050 /DNA_ORIENTATION=+
MKRGSERQITKDDAPAQDDDQSDETPGTFQRASNDVIQGRKILKARRRTEPSDATPAAASEAPKANPFASFALAKVEKAAKEAPEKPTETKEPNAEDKVAKKTDGVEPEKPVAEQGAPTDDAVENPEKEKKTEAKVDGETEREAKAEEPAKDDVPAVEPANDSKPVFQFGSKPLFSFASSAAVPATGAPNFAFGAAAAASDGKPSSTEGAPAKPTEPIIPEQPALTGEEGEEARVKIRAKLFILDGSQWKERGVGMLKMNIRSEEDGKKGARLIMRLDGSQRVVLNFFLWSDFKLDNSAEKMTRFVTIEDGKPSSYLVKLKSKEDQAALADAVDKWLASTSK